MDEFNPDLITNYIFGNKIKGLTTEIINTVTVTNILQQSTSNDHLEHMTSYIYQFPKLYNILSIKQLSDYKPSLKCYAIDEVEDYTRMNKIFEYNPCIDLTVESADEISKLY